MLFSNKKETLFLFLGDVIILYVSLWVALTLRQFALPSEHLLSLHIWPFTILIIAWILSFFIAGLYDKHTLLFRRKLPVVLLHTQIINMIVGVFFFYLIPYFSITPKTNLFIYLAISSLFILAWRLYGPLFIGTRKKVRGVVIGSGREKDELLKEINQNPRYNLTFITAIDLKKKNHTDIQDEVFHLVEKKNVSVIVIDLYNEKVELALPSLYNLLFSRVQFMELHKVYEHVFDRIPLSLINYRWFLGNISTTNRILYDAAKRVMDVVITGVVGAASLVFYPFVYALIKWDDGGPVFIYQERVGRGGDVVRIVKFRTMVSNDKGKWVVKDDPRITRAGKTLRATRIDEFPQLWNVLKGDLSLVGPRPELPDLVRLYEKEIPYYNIRHLIKPGLSGWGQIHHDKPPHSIEETKEKLAYDLYYIKRRSFLLDLEIALKTVKTLLSRSGV